MIATASGVLVLGAAILTVVTLRSVRTDSKTAEAGGADAATVTVEGARIAVNERRGPQSYSREKR